MSFLDDFFGKAPAIPDAPNLDLGGINSAFPDFLSQLQFLPQLQNFATQINTGANDSYQAQLEKLFPSLKSLLGQQQANTGSFLRGEIPQDVQDAVSRSGAEQALNNGYGAGSGMGRNLVARDFGLTSLNLMDKGNSQLPGEISEVQALNPSNVSPASMLFSPSQVLQRQDAQKQFNYNVGRQNSATDYANSLRRSPFEKLLTNTAASVISAPFNMVQDAAGIVSHAPSLALSAYTGGLMNSDAGAQGGGGGMGGGFGSMFSSIMGNKGGAGGGGMGGGSSGGTGINNGLPGGSLFAGSDATFNNQVQQLMNLGNNRNGYGSGGGSSNGYFF